MANINRVTISGRLTRDPELRTLPSGTSVLALGVAVNDRRRDQITGEWGDYANFIDCTMFGKRCDGLSHILAKGSLVFIEGRLRYSTWERDGVKRSKIEVIIDEIETPGSPQGSDGAHRRSEPTQAPYEDYVPAYQAQPQGDMYEDDSIPF